MKQTAMIDLLRKGVTRALQSGAAGAKMVWTSSEKIGCEFENGRLKETGAADHLGLEADVLLNGRRGSASGNIPERLDAMIDQALTLAQAGGIAHFSAWPGLVATHPVPAHSARTLALTRETLIERCAEMADALKGYDPDLFVCCSASRKEAQRCLATSGGVDHAFARTSWNLGAHVQRTRDNDILFAGHGRSGCELDARFDARAIAEHILTDLRHAERAAPPPKGRTTAFFPADRLIYLLYPVFMGIDGRNVAKGDSPLAGKIGARILAENITLEDRPHTPMTPQSAERDADGIPTQNRILIDRGVLKTFLYDLDSAGLANAEPTGNDHCAPYRPCIVPGTESSDSLLQRIGDGLLVKNLIGYGQSNIVNGDFSCNVGLGYRIEKGKIVGRVKNAMISGNIYDLLSGTVTLSSDTDDDGCFPNAVVEGLDVSAGS